MVDPFKMKVDPGVWPKTKCSVIKPTTKAKVLFDELYDYGSAAAFEQKVDNALAGQMRDCAECHVGGGGMEYVIAAKGADLTAISRLSLRELGTITDTYLTTVNGACKDSLSDCVETDDTKGPITASNYTVLNYFIDQYDDDNDGVLGEALLQDYASTGVLEMDCLMCHLEGYSWTDRKEAVRKGNFDSSRSAGAGFGAVLTGTTVDYTAGSGVTDDGTNLLLDAGVLYDIKGAPPNANCSSCHFDMHQVDWKKRGASWSAAMAYNTEVHASIGCMGCHERTDGIDMDPNNTDASVAPDDTIDDGAWTGKATTKPGILGHDPTKQFAPYSSLWNFTDAQGGGKTCEGCHYGTTAGNNFGAVDPTAAHEAMGLTGADWQIVQSGRGGVQDADHLDIITCDACHTRKLGHGPTDDGSGNTHGSLYEWGTGGALVDSTGADADGRLTDHENLYVERTMENNLVRGWSGGKLSSRHALVTMFWRDKDDLFGVGNVGTYTDINADGQDGAMDPVNPSHVRDAMIADGLDVLTHDGVMDGAEIGAQAAAIKTYLGTLTTPIDATAAKLKLSFMGVLFRANHGTSPASYAWGAGGCTDCHADGAGFYNGAYDLKPRDLDASWDNFVYAADGVTKVMDNSAIGGKKPKWKYVVPFTKVNAENYSGRDVTMPICSTYYGPDPRPAPPTQGTLLDIGNPCTEGGTSGTWTVYGLGKIKADYQFSDFHPTLWAKGMTSRTIAVNAAYATSGTIRTIDRSELIYAASEATPLGPGDRTMVDGSIGGRSVIVATLNSVGNYNKNMHNIHMDQTAMGTLAAPVCADCHLTGQKANEPPPSDGSGLLASEIAYTYTGYYTCTSACHDDGVSINPTDPGEIQVNAQFSALPSADVDLTVTYDASRATCVKWDDGGASEELSCSYTWSFPGMLVVVGGDVATDLVTVAYPAADVGTCDAGTGTCSGGQKDTQACTVDAECWPTYTTTLTMATSGVSDTQSVDVDAQIVEDPVADIDFAPTGEGSDTITMDATLTSLPVSLVKAYIYWGDRTRTVSYAPETELIDGSLTHTYRRSGTYNIRVMVYDAGHIMTNYTPAQDIELSVDVTVP